MSTFVFNLLMCHIETLYIKRLVRALHQELTMEASGDSEEDSAPAVDGSVLLPSVEDKADADADDCESCIHDLHDSSYDEDDDKHKYVDAEADVTMMWQYAKVIEKEDAEKLVDADEEGKLFWEACLASGYP